MLVALTGVYAGGLHGPFVFDDGPNITDETLIAIDSLSAADLAQAFFAERKSYPHRGLARVSFALNYYFSGRVFDPYVFKVTNLAIHALNGLLVYWLSVLLLKRYALASPGAQPSATMRWLPLVVAAVWVLHPIHLTSVLYVVQRMTSMAGTFVFAGLLVFVLGRTRVEDGRGGGFWLMLGGLGGGTILGFLCKQTAVLLPFLAFVVEWFFFRRERLSRPVRSRLWLFYAVVVGVPAAAGLVGLVVGWEQVVQMYSRRDFTPWERLLSESRILFFYLALLLVPYLRWYGLYHDDLAVSRGWLEPWTTLPSVLGWACLLGLAAWGMRRRALWAFALAWYVVGHALESTVLGLELVFEHRNYVPSFGVLLVACWYLVRALQALPNLRRVMWPLLGATLGVLAFTTYARAHAWQDWGSITASHYRNHPNSYRAHVSQVAVMRGEGRPTGEIYPVLQRAAALRPTAIQPVVQMLEMATAHRHLVVTGGVPRSRTEGALDSFALWTDPLINDVSYLDQVVDLLGHAVAERLKEGPISAETLLVLDGFQRCSAGDAPGCRPHRSRVVAWLESALANPRAQAPDRASLDSLLARAHASLDAPGLALAHARRATDHVPQDPLYLHAWAMLAIELDRRDEAHRALQRIESLPSWHPSRKWALDRVMARLGGANHESRAE